MPCSSILRIIIIIESDFKDSPFGKDSFDLWVYKNPYHYQDIFTGFVFYIPIERVE